MVPLLALTAVLLLVSGAVKLRAAARAKVGLHLFSLLEILAGALLFLVMMAVPLAGEQGLAVATGATLLIVVSSVHLGSRLRHQRHLRDLTEGRRLESYVKYMSKVPEETGDGDG